MLADETPIIVPACPTDEISAYIDGELDIARERAMAAHLIRCDACALDLTQQKQFLCGLSASLRQEKEFCLPPNFARTIVASAESAVSGVRRPRELYNAIFICAGLFLFVLFAMGAESSSLVAGIYGAFGQLAVVGGFFGSLIYSLFVGIVIVVRSLATQFRFDPVMAVVVAAFTVSFMFASLKFLRIRRA